MRERTLDPADRPLALHADAAGVILDVLRNFAPEDAGHIEVVELSVIGKEDAQRFSALYRHSDLVSEVEGVHPVISGSQADEVVGTASGTVDDGGFLLNILEARRPFVAEIGEKLLGGEVVYAVFSVVEDLLEAVTVAAGLGVRNS